MRETGSLIKLAESVPSTVDIRRFNHNPAHIMTEEFRFLDQQ